MNGGIGRLMRRDATAADAYRVLEQHGLINADPQTRALGGFELIGGHGDIPPAGTLCSVGAMADGVLIVAEIGASGRTLIPYPDLLGVETSGRGVIVEQRLVIDGNVTYGGRISATARARPSLRPSKRTVESFLRITARHSELRLRNWKLPPDTVRDHLGRIFAAQLHAAKTSPPPVVIEVPAPATAPEPTPAGPLDELERLTKLHAAGALTDTEFELARAKQIQRLHSS
jgi:hypothetical protein